MEFLELVLNKKLFDRTNWSDPTMVTNRYLSMALELAVDTKVNVPLVEV